MRQEEIIQILNEHGTMTAREIVLTKEPNLRDWEINYRVANLRVRLIRLKKWGDIEVAYVDEKGVNHWRLVE